MILYIHVQYIHKLHVHIHVSAHVPSLAGTVFLSSQRRPQQKSEQAKHHGHHQVQHFDAQAKVDGEAVQMETLRCRPYVPFKPLQAV